MPVYYWDMDGVLADYHGYVKGNWALGALRETYENLPAFQHNVNVLNALIAQGITCYILTKGANENAKAGKREWLRKYVPALEDDRFICILKGRKVDYIREDGTLIDDDDRNTKAWIKGGHTAILLTVKGEDVTIEMS